jgi:hypothetical protein
VVLENEGGMLNMIVSLLFVAGYQRLFRTLPLSVACGVVWGTTTELLFVYVMLYRDPYYVVGVNNVPIIQIIFIWMWCSVCKCMYLTSPRNDRLLEEMISKYIIECYKIICENLVLISILQLKWEGRRRG